MPVTRPPPHAARRNALGVSATRVGDARVAGRAVRALRTVREIGAEPILPAGAVPIDVAATVRSPKWPARAALTQRSTAGPVAPTVVHGASSARPRFGPRAEAGDDRCEPSNRGPRPQALDQAPTADLAGSPLFLHPSPPSRGAGGTSVAGFVLRGWFRCNCLFPWGRCNSRGWPPAGQVSAGSRSIRPTSTYRRRRRPRCLRRGRPDR